MNYSEAVAKRVLEAILPGATLVYRSAQANGEYDFDLRYSDGTVAAVEVTAAVDQTLTETIAAVRSKKKGGSIIKATVCKKSWLIFPAKGASINTIRTAADGYLANLEHEGIDSFHCVSMSPSVRNICCQLQVTGRRSHFFGDRADDPDCIPSWRWRSRRSHCDQNCRKRVVEAGQS